MDDRCVRLNAFEWRFTSINLVFCMKSNLFRSSMRTFFFRNARSVLLMSNHQVDWSNALVGDLVWVSDDVEVSASFVHIGSLMQHNIDL